MEFFKGIELLDIMIAAADKVARIGAPQAISTQPVCDTVTVYQYDDMGRLVQTTDRAGKPAFRNVLLSDLPGKII